MANFSHSQWRRLLASLLFLSLPTTQTTVAAGLPPIRDSQSLGEIVVSPPVMKHSAPTLSLAERVERLEGLLEGQALVEMLMRIETLQRDVQELRGQNEVFSHDIEGMKKRQRDLYMDIDRRLRQVTMQGTRTEQSQASMTPTPSAGLSGDVAGSRSAIVGAAFISGRGEPALQQPVAQGETLPAGGQLDAAPAIDPLAEQSAYRLAFNVLKEGRYEDSIGSFNQFLGAYPNGQYADNAHYWIGEANYVLRRFLAAIESFNQVLNVFPNSPKIPDAMLKIGFSYYELQQWDASRQILEVLIQKFPATTASQLAKNRVQQLKADGR